MAWSFSLSFGDDQADSIREHYRGEDGVSSTKDCKSRLKSDIVGFVEEEILDE